MSVKKVEQDLVHESQPGPSKVNKKTVQQRVQIKILTQLKKTQLLRLKQEPEIQRKMRKSEVCIITIVQCIKSKDQGNKVDDQEIVYREKSEHQIPDHLPNENELKTKLSNQARKESSAYKDDLKKKRDKYCEKRGPDE